MAQMQTFSGDRGKGHCYLFSNITCSSGSILAVTPGPNISCPPRGGDGVSLGVQHGLAAESERTTGVPTGHTRFCRGTPNIGVGLVVDKGYIHQPNVNTGSNPTLLEYCQTNNILPLYRANTGDMAFNYNPETDLLEQIQNNPDPTLAVNGGRVVTFARAGAENTHVFKKQYKYFGHQAHNSRLNAIGQRKITHYNRKFDKQFGREWAEMSKLNAEYLVMAGRFNQWHAKFAR